MRARAMGFLVLALMACPASVGAQPAVASGRNWRISLGSIECEAAASVVAIGMRIRYLGPDGPVEAPVSQLTDDKGKPYVPKSLVLRPGSKPLAEWLSAGGLRNIRRDYAGEVQLKYEVRGATGALHLEFGDIKAFALARKPTAVAKGVCERLLKPGEIQGPRARRPDRVEGSKLKFPVYRARYPCIPPSTIAAEYPPYLPKQLLLFGRGFLPNARQIELPMGRAGAQSYSYVGPDELRSVEDAARRALGADFPEYSAAKYFGFNWGVQKSLSGNDVYSIGIYDVRPCPK